MAYRNISVTLSTNVGAFRQQMASASAAVNGFSTASVRASSAASRAAKDAGSSFDGLGGKMQSLAAKTSGLRAAMAGVTAIAGIGFGLKMAGDIEMTEVAFTGLLGSAERAGTFMRELQQFTARTPFEFPGVTNAAQQFLALGHSTGEIQTQLALIADALSVAGNIGDEALSRVVRALTQIEGKGRLSAEEINQLAEVMPGAGRANIFENLAEKLDITSQEAQKLAEQGLIPASIGLEAVYEAMAEIPGAAGAADRASRTLLGTMSNLRDTVRFAVADAFRPLADTLRDTLNPMLDDIKPLLAGIMGPLGGGLGDIFTGLAASFQQLAPYLPAIADAFGSLLSALANLLPVATTLIDTALTPLAPLIQGVAGALEFLTSNGQVLTPILYGLLAGFAGFKLAPLISSVGQFAASIFTLYTQSVLASSAMLTASVSLTALGTAAKTALASINPVTAAITAVTTAIGIAVGWWATHQKSTEDNKARIDELTATFDKNTGAITENTNAKIVGFITDMNLDKAAKAAGISIGTLTSAITGNALAHDEARIKAGNHVDELYRVYEAAVRTFGENSTQAQQAANDYEVARQAANELDSGINEIRGDVTSANSEWARQNALLGSLNSLTGAVNSELNKMPNALDAAQLGWKKVQEQAAKTFGTEAAWKKYQSSVEDAHKKATAAALDEIAKRFDAEEKRLDQAEKAERESYDRRVEERRRQLDEQLEAEEEAIDEAHEIAIEAVEARYDAERDALEEQREAEEEAMALRHRAEKQALDARIQLLQQAADKRKRIEKREYENERDNIQWMIDNTFGAEREMWKARLIELDEQHQDRIDTIDNETDAEKTTWQNALQDQQDDEKESLDDRFDYLEEVLDKRETAEKNHQTKTYEDAKNAFEARAFQQKTALDNEVSDHKTHLDQKYADLKADLKARESEATTAETTRRENAKAHYGFALADFKQFLADETRAANEFNKNMAIIVSRGGRDVMEEIAGFDPAIVAQMAALPADQFDAWLDAIRANIAAGKEPLPGGGGARPQDIRGRGGVHRANADGSINRTARISNTPILWAEAGPEAYIPLSKSRSRTAVPILAQTAAALGYNVTPMAAGGVIGWDGATIGRGDTNFNMPIHIEARVAAGVDPDAVGRAIAVYAKRAVDEAIDAVGRQVVTKRGY